VSHSAASRGKAEVKLSRIGIWRLLAVPAAVALATASSASASAAAPTVWGPAQRVHISASLGQDPNVTAISCPAPGNCVAGGVYYADPGFQAFIIEQKEGVWGNAQPIPGMAALDGGRGSEILSISCSSPGNCAVVGDADDLSATPAMTPRGFVVSEVNGVWSMVDALPPPAPSASVKTSVLRSVSCTAPGDCLAGGFDTTTGLATTAVTVEETNGTWGTPTEVAGAAPFDRVNSVSCASPGECAAGISNVRAETAELATESGGTWSAAQPVPGLAALPGGPVHSTLYSVSCPAAGNCTAAGEVGITGEPVFVVDEKNGSWGDASELAGGRAVGALEIFFDQTPLACASAGNCVVTGTLNGLGFIAGEVNGTWSSPDEWEYPTLKSVSATVNTLSCPSPGNCSAGGVVPIGPPGNQLAPFLIDETNGTWGSATGVTGASVGSEIDAMSCASADSCVAVDSDGLDSRLTQKIPVAATTTAISLSVGSVVYGHEQSQRISVKVSAGSGIPTGTVAVKSGTATVCMIKLSGGGGSCDLPALRFAAGKVTLGAAYSGPAWFAASTSPPTSFVVVKAATKTELHLSAARVKYGHEQAEKFSVMVRPAYAGTATGEVAIRAGKITVCTIKLKAGQGSCSLEARTLKIGTYHLAAHYAGSAHLTGSTSAKRTLVVTSG